MMNIDSPGVVAEMMAAFERHERALVSNDAGMLDGRLRADARPAHLAGVIGEHRENVNARRPKNECPVWTRADSTPGFSKLEPKRHNPGCRKRFRLRVEINDWRRL